MALSLGVGLESRLVDALGELSILLQAKSQVRHLWKATLIYPTFLALGFAGLVILAAVFLTYYTGLLEQVAALSGHESLDLAQQQHVNTMPLSTRFILDLRRILTTTGPLSFLLPVGVYAFLSVPANRLRIPFWSAHLLDREACLIMRWLDWSLCQGRSLPEAVRQAAAACSVPALAGQLRELAEALERGSAFGQALDQVSLFPSLAGWLLKRAEAAQFKPGSLSHAVEAYSARMDNRMRYMWAFLQPFLVLIFAAATCALVFVLLKPLLPNSGIGPIF
jgi:type II secretory pathway component PulF